MKQEKPQVKTINAKRYGWAIKMFILSLCLSSLFSLASQSLMASLGLVMSIITICIFIFISIVFDMIGIAVTACQIDFFEKEKQKNTKGSFIGLQLVKNSEKVCSFCADVVGDICGILSGAGGACIIMSLTGIIENPSLTILISTLISAFIAGITIFGKACMKEYAIKNANKIILRIGKIAEKIFLIKAKK